MIRRDFLQGAAIGLGGLALGCQHLSSSKKKLANKSIQTMPVYGFGGHTSKAQALGHKLRNPSARHSLLTQKAFDQGDTYDLIVIGAGISGLATAHHYNRLCRSQAKILVIDNHSEIGGHARRNTFQYKAQNFIAQGGSYTLEDIEETSEEVLLFFNQIGLDLDRLANFKDNAIYERFRLSSAVLCDPRHFGHQQPSWHLGFHSNSYEKIFASMPISKKIQMDLTKLYDSREDFCPKGQNKQEYLRSISWAEFITQRMNLDPLCTKFANLYASDLCGLGSDAISAYDAFDIGPGFFGMGGKGFFKNRQNVLQYAYQPTHRFPDGNFTIAKMILKQLIPQSIYGNSMEDIFCNAIDSSQLNAPSQKIQIKLNSLATELIHDYKYKNQVRVKVISPDHKAYYLRCKHAVVATWGSIAKHIVPELKAQQKQALSNYAHTSALYINILLKQWRPFANLGANEFYLPDGYCTWMSLSDPIKLGSYQPVYHPDHPIILSMYKYLYRPGLAPLKQMRYGRHEIEQKSFADYEREIKNELNYLFAPMGFDASRDIAGIMINRWGHGYNFFKGSLPHNSYEDGRRSLDRISFAGADSGGEAWLQAAVAQGIRAAEEQFFD